MYPPPPMSTKKPRILLRIGPDHLATVLNVPTDRANLDTKARQSTSPSASMAATSVDLTQNQAAQHKSSGMRFQGRNKMTPQKQYRSKKSLRNLQNHIPQTTTTTTPTTTSSVPNDDTEESQVVTPPETATESSYELKQAAKHDNDSQAAPTRKRVRKETFRFANQESEERSPKPHKAPRKLTPATSVGVAPGQGQGLASDEQQDNENRRSLRSQDPKKASDLALLFQDELPPGILIFFLNRRLKSFFPSAGFFLCLTEVE